MNCPSNEKKKKEKKKKDCFNPIENTEFYFAHWFGPSRSDKILTLLKFTRWLSQISFKVSLVILLL